MRRPRQEPRPGVRDDARDAGTTVAELVVAVAVFAACTAVFLAGVVQMTRLTVRAQVVADNTDQLRSAFTRMDTTLRYAEAVNAPGVVGRSWFLEFRTPGAGGQTDTCTQWRYSVTRGVLEERQWDSTQAPGSRWTTLAGRLSQDSAVLTDPTRVPFVMTPASATQGHQLVAVLLEARRAGTRTSSAPQTSAEQVRATFTALNSDAASNGNVLLADGTSKDPTCSPSTTRTE